MADRDRLGLISGNLVPTAVKSTGGTVTLRLTSRAGEGLQQLKAKDTGQGIPGRRARFSSPQSVLQAKPAPPERGSG